MTFLRAPSGPGLFSPWLLLQWLIVAQVTLGFQFYLHAGETRCFSDSAPPNTKILGEYTVSTGKGQMPVDIAVRLAETKAELYSRRNVDHGKFAFVLPYSELDVPDVQKAELHRKMVDHIHKLRHRLRGPGLQGNQHGFEPHVDSKHNHGHPQSRRRLLNVDSHEEEREGLHARHVHHGGEPESDEDEYDYEDDLDEFDQTEYDGIHDERLEHEAERNEESFINAQGRTEDVSDFEKERRAFDSRKFEICVTSEGDKTGVKRRVRLILHKGADAHDYTRLAKKEHLTQLEVSLREVSGELNELMHELDQAREMEDILRKLNENTNQRVFIFAALSLISLFAVGGYQALYTKRFFKRKKIL